MNRMTKNNTTRMTAVLLCMLMLIMMLLSSFYLSIEAGHHCEEDDCPICATMQECENVLHQIGGGLITQIAIAMPFLMVFFAALLVVCELPQETLISQKVRLNN